jgi:hypothetical protein
MTEPAAATPRSRKARDLGHPVDKLGVRTPETVLGRVVRLAPVVGEENERPERG